MTTQEVNEGNKLIAEFMGGTVEPINHPFLSIRNKYGNVVEYEKNWHDLMSVVEKIETIGFDVSIKGISCSINRLCETKTIVQVVLGERSRKIELVWITVIEFIKWYNQNK